MRALTYIAKKGTEIIETASWKEREELKNDGYTITEKLIDITPSELADALNE